MRSLIRRLRDDRADGETARKAGQRLRKLEDHHRPTKEKRAPKPGWRPEVGERVRLLALAKAAEVLAISDDGLAAHGALRRDAQHCGTQCC